jgi:uncharacterized membrane protein YsdA (DUF1294 family)
MIPVLLVTGASILPTVALIKASATVDGRYITGYLLIISLLTVYFYWSDKRKAQGDSWRTPETTLHLLELLGGWVAAFFSQRRFRHKISKRAYQLKFWMIAGLHQCLSFDFLCGWRYTQLAYDFLKSFF